MACDWLVVSTAWPACGHITVEAGLRLGVPLRDTRWRLPLRLAVTSMVVLVGLITAVGVWVQGLSLSGAVLLAAMLAPTDPVLAAEISPSRDRSLIAWVLGWPPRAA